MNNKPANLSQSPTSEAINVLLLQIRQEERVRLEEFNSFVNYSGLHQTQLKVHNVFDQPRFGPEILDGFDALFVGGASEASVLEPETYPFVRDCIKLLQYSIETTVPVFASCFGFQLAVLALGGKIIRDETDYEMGTISIQLTESAKSDPLFCDVPNGFAAVAVHKERAPILPKQCELLAHTAHCAHAFKVTDKPFWAFQFHPEVDRATLIERLTIFKQHYTDGDDHLSNVLNNSVETPHSNHLVKKFVDRILGPKPT